MKILTLFIKYGDQDYSNSFYSLQKFYKDIDLENSKIIIVDNAIPAEVRVNIGLNAVLINGDNEYREFSGWNNALALIASEMFDYDLVHFVTSAFENEYNGFYPLITKEMLAFIASDKLKVLCHIDASEHEMWIAGRSFQTWGCSKFIFMSPEMLRRIGSPLSNFGYNDIFTNDYHAPFHDEAPISSVYKNKLLSWLIKSDSNEDKWPDAFILNEKSFSKFQVKSLAIINEQFLSVRLREAEALLIDVTCLSLVSFDDYVHTSEDIQVGKRNIFLFNNSLISFDNCYPEYRFKNESFLILKPLTKNSLSLSPIIEQLYLGNSHLRNLVNKDSEYGIGCLWLWYFVEYFDSRGVVPKEFYPWLLKVNDDVLQDQSIELTNGLCALCCVRDDLNNTFDLSTIEGRSRLVDWWMLSGIGDDKLPAMLTDESYRQLSTQVEQDAPLPISQGLYALWHCRSDLKESIDISTIEGRSRLVDWWMLSGIGDDKLPAMLADESYRQLSTQVEQDAPLPISQGLYALWHCRSDLKESIDLSTIEGRSRLVDWWMLSGIGDDKLPALLTDEAYQQESKVVEQNTLLSSSHALDEELTLQKLGDYKFDGVNVVGFSRGELGIGEDVRMAAGSLANSCSKFVVFNAPLEIRSKESDSSADVFLSSSPQYNINLIFLPFYETLRLHAKTKGLVISNRYNVGCYQWELSKVPIDVSLALDISDEIWCSSRFIYKAMKKATAKPVYYMPMAVELPSSYKGGYSREYFNLPEDKFIFISIFDMNSGFYRKNPLGTVGAFLSAFDPHDETVHLVLKTMNTMHDLAWQKIVDLCENDSRITLIEEKIMRDELLGLQSVCDCYVSLHRAEGFGRNIAEAMLLSRSVIVSNYSGSTDFCTNSTSYLVNGTLVAVGEGEYAYSHDQEWFEPNIDQAAEAMKNCIFDGVKRSKRIQSAYGFILENYSFKTVGDNYIARIKKINRFLKGSEINPKSLQ
jgi:hypothetical protein